MPRTFIPATGLDSRVRYVPLKLITYIDPGPANGFGPAYAWTKDGSRHTLHKDWRDPATHLHLRKPT